MSRGIYRPGIELHCHANCSDGSLPPDEVMRHLRRCGVRVAALTDHDSVAGLELAHTTAAELGLGFLNGCEFSALHQGQVIHVVALDFDPAEPRIQRLLHAAGESRAERARGLCAALTAVGFPVSWEEALAEQPRAEAIGRPHLAQILIRKGLCADFDDAIGKLMEPGRPAHVPETWIELRDLLPRLKEAGATSVMAHPGRYRFSTEGRRGFFRAFKEWGGDAVEILCGQGSGTDVQRFGSLALRMELKISAASDFHHKSKWGRPNHYLFDIPPRWQDQLLWLGKSWDPANFPAPEFVAVAGPAEA